MTSSQNVSGQPARTDAPTATGTATEAAAASTGAGSTQPPSRQEALAAADRVINWEAVTQAASFVPPGPSLTRAEAATEVKALRAAAAEAVGHVHTITGLEAAANLGEDLSDVLIVDRPGWSQANAASFRELLAPGFHTLVNDHPEMAPADSKRAKISASVAGAQFGAVMSFLSANVLGQFEPFTQQRLMLVAPNIVDVAAQLNVDRADFRLWVCLHEQTHRVQFAAAPWLADHLRAKMTELTTSMLADSGSLPQRLAEAATALKDQLTGTRDTTQNTSDNDGEPAPPTSARALLNAVQSPEDRERMSHLTAVMSLLEGHANVVMDAVDASVVPTVKTIRRRFEDRSKRRTGLQKMIRRLLQMDVKAAQYRDGQKFVGHIVNSIGMEGFNRIWESAEHLPTETELHNPDLWIARVQELAPTQGA